METGNGRGAGNGRRKNERMRRRRKRREEGGDKAILSAQETKDDEKIELDRRYFRRAKAAVDRTNLDTD